jgi:hypothetical protein
MSCSSESASNWSGVMGRATLSLSDSISVNVGERGASCHVRDEARGLRSSAPEPWLAPLMSNGE